MATASVSFDSLLSELNGAIGTRRLCLMNMFLHNIGDIDGDRTNVHHTLKKKPLTRDRLQDFVDCYNPKNRHEREATWNLDTNPEGRWRRYSYDEITSRDKTSLDIFWLKDKSLSDLENLPEPEILAEQIIENLEAGLGSFRDVLTALQA